MNILWCPGAYTVELSMAFPPNTRNRSAIGPSCTTLGHIPKALYILLQRHLLINAHCCAFHTSQGVETAQTHEWIKDNEMWYIHTMEFYSAVKKNKIRIFTGKWVKLEK